MGNPSAKRRRPEGEGYRKPSKKIRNFKKQKNYHSSSEESDDENEDIQTRLARFNPISPDASDAEEGDKQKKRKEGGRKKKNNAAAASASASKEDLKSAPKPTPAKAAPKKPVDSQSESEDDEEEQDEDEDEDEDEDDEDDDTVQDLDDLEDDDELDLVENDEFDDSDADSDASTSRANGKKRKRNDPTAFANSMSKILSSKLSNAKRSDPVLSRSVDAATASKELIDARLEAKAKRQMHAERRQALEKGRVKDVLGLETTNVSTAHIQEQERRLKKTAQRGVVKLFNAVRAAQVKGEQAREEAKREGVVGMGQREERASEMSKKGFLDLLAQGGKKAPAMNVDEA